MTERIDWPGLADRVREIVVHELCEHYVAYWVERLGLQRWSITVRYDERQDWAAASIENAHNEIGSVHFNSTALKKSSEDDIEYYAVHELVHLIIERAIGKNVPMKVYEDVIVALARALINTRDMGE